MDWTSFLSEVIAGIVGAVVGVVGALWFDRRKQTREARKLDLKLMQDLVHYLAGRRAFRRNRTIVGVVDPVGVFDKVDLERCNRSVLNVRERIASAREALQRPDELLPILQNMEADCANYLSSVRSEETLYANSLLALGDRLLANEQRLQEVLPSLEVEAPGSRVDADASWLPAT